MLLGTTRQQRSEPVRISTVLQPGTGSFCDDQSSKNGPMFQSGTGLAEQPCGDRCRLCLSAPVPVLCNCRVSQPYRALSRPGTLSCLRQLLLSRPCLYGIHRRDGQNVAIRHNAADFPHREGVGRGWQEGELLTRTTRRRDLDWIGSIHHPSAAPGPATFADIMTPSATARAPIFEATLEPGQKAAEIRPHLLLR